MGYDDYRDRVNLYWTHRNTDFDRKTDARISSLQWEVERDNLSSGTSTNSFNPEDNGDVKPFETPSVANMIADIRRESNRMNAYIFDSYREKLADEVDQNEDLPQTTRTHIPPLIRAMIVTDVKTPEILQAHMDSIDAAVQLALHIKRLLNFRLALIDIKDGLLKMQEVAKSYYHKP